MQLLFVLAAMLALSALGFALGRSRARRLAVGRRGRTSSLPGHFGMYVALWCGLPALAITALWLGLDDRVIEALVRAGLPDDLRGLPPDRIGLLLTEIRNAAAGSATFGEPSPAVLEAAEALNRLHAIGTAAMAVAALSAALGGLAWARSRITPRLHARERVERMIRIGLLASSTVAVLTTLGIVLSLVFEAARFFRLVSPAEFFFGLSWSPQTAIHAEQVGSSGAFGAVPLFAGTLLIALVAMLVAAPVGLFSAIYMAEYAPPRLRSVAKPLIEILAGIPTVVYGFFAALTVAPLLRDIGGVLGLAVSSESALAAGLVMGIMIIPFVSSLSDDAIAAVPRAMRDGALALGATRSETIRRVVIPAALPGIAGGMLLAVSRAIGETMIVVMAAGLAANLTANPFAAVTTVTAQIVALLVGDQEFDSAKTLAAFALGLTLFVVTLGLNVMALAIVRRYREQYE